MLGRTEGAQLAEFAVSLPLLVVFVVSIYDFGNAFNIKYKLADAVREGARFAVTEPGNDLSSSAPPSIGEIPKLVGSYLKSVNVNDCGLSTVTSGTPQSPLVWVYSVNSGCTGNLTLTINRGLAFTVPSTTLYPTGQTVEATQVTISYPYRWQFTNVIKLIAPNSNYATNATITTSATMSNLN
jgi:Flp pilus assembly protein TadG